MLTNLLSDLPPPETEETVEIILRTETVRLERIVSYGHASPKGFWYDQEEAEWVMLLTGGARLRLENESADRSLTPGDQLYLPPHCRHRVTWTAPDQPTVWLALFMKNTAENALSAAIGMRTIFSL